MKSISQKRKYIMDYMTKFYDLLDPTGDNSKMFQKKYGSMTDEEFSKSITSFFNNEKSQFYLEVVEFERDLSLENVFKCADFMKIPLFEKVALPHINGSTENAIVTPQPVPVGYIHAKRMQQTLLKKNSGSISIKKRNAQTNQVIDKDKNARNSNVETYSMIASGANMALKEFMGPRADDSVAKNQMYSKISTDGYVALADLDDDVKNKVSINRMDEFFTMQGFRTNLVAPPEILPSDK